MRRKVKVMALISHMGPGGAQELLINYLRVFKNDSNIEFKLFVLEKSIGSKYDLIIKNEDLNVVYLNVPQSKCKIPYLRRIPNRIIASKYIDNAIKNYKPDIIHTHITAILYSALSPILKNKINIKFNTLHSDPKIYKGINLIKNRFAFNKAGVIPICVNEEQVVKAKKRYKIKKWELVRNGIDLNYLYSARINKKDARSKLNLPENSIIIGTVGRLNKIKNYELLIESFYILSKKRSDVILVFAGDGPETLNLKMKSKKLGIEKKVVFLGNVINPILVYCAIDIFALTSHYESCSLATIEAQLFDIKCVVSSGIPDESVITNNVIKLPKNSKSEEWAENLLWENESKKICIPIRGLEDYDVINSIKTQKEIYLKYWRNEYYGK